MKRLGLVGVLLVALGGLGLAESASAATRLHSAASTESQGTTPEVGHSHGDAISDAVTAGSFWTYYDLSAWPSSGRCEIIAFHSKHLYSGTWGDNGSWKSSGKTLKMTIPTGSYLSPGTFKGVLTTNDNYVGLVSNKGLSPYGPEELAPGSDPSGAGTCVPPS
jgi:hypothetical protein